MAITQERILTLLKIADELKSQLLFHNRTISTLISELPISPSHDDLLTTIQAIQNLNNSLSISPHSIETLASEKAHFKLNQQRNLRQKLRARQKRGHDLETTPVRATAPMAIGEKPVTLPTQKMLYGAAAKYNTPAIMSDEELSKHTDITLADHKYKINEFYVSQGAAEPYPDPYDDSVPLTDDHKRYLGLPVASTKTLF